MLTLSILIGSTLINVTRFALMGVLYTHSFKTHFSPPFDDYINGPTAHVFNTAESLTVVFIQASFSSLCDIHECLGGFQSAPSSLDKQTADYDSPHNWLMSLAMDITAVCDMWR